MPTQQLSADPALQTCQSILNDLTLSPLLIPQELEAALWRLFRDYFDQMDKTRRWSMETDIPWEQVCGSLPPEFIEVVDTLYLDKAYVRDYAAQIIRQIRISPGRSWFFLVWGYEELKHGLAINDWLLRSGQRTDQDINVLEHAVRQHEWESPHPDALGLLIHTLVRERCWWVCYRNLKQRVEALEGGAALARLLKRIATDELAHYQFLEEVTQLIGKANPDRLTEKVSEVLAGFTLLTQPSDAPRRLQTLADLDLFGAKDFELEVRQPILEALGVPAEKALPAKNHPVSPRLPKVEGS